MNPTQADYAAAASLLRDDLLHPGLPRHFKDLLQRMLALCEAGTSLPQDYGDQYNKYLAYRQRQDKYGK